VTKLSDLAGEATPPDRLGSVRGVVAVALPVAAMLMLGMAYGNLAHSQGWFPTGLVEQARLGYHAVKQGLGLELRWPLEYVGDVPEVKSYQPDKIAPGLTLVTGYGADNRSMARVVDRNGKIVHAWDLDWFRIWPDQ
jgi:hypothetical protein